jgi:hypothetical protein
MILVIATSYVCDVELNVATTLCRSDRVKRSKFRQILPKVGNGASAADRRINYDFNVIERERYREILDEPRGNPGRM